MRTILFLLIVGSSLFAANILSYNIYDRTERVDLMFTFDTPFTGTVTQQRRNDKLIIKLSQSSIESPKIKNIASKFVSKLTVAPIGDEVQIIAKVPNDVVMKASKTSDGYGLRLRFVAKTPTAVAAPSNTTNESLNKLPTKAETTISTSYIIVITLLLMSVVALLLFKKRLTSSNGTGTFSLFNKESDTQHNVNIRFQKSIDANNKVVMLEFAQENYLLLLGNTNLILDKFDHSNVKTQSEFEQMLDSKHQELDQFLKIKKESEAFESYKDKASGIDTVIDDLEIKG